MRSWAYYRRYGRELELMSEHAVLNANYLRHQIMNPDQEQLDSIHSMPVDGAPADFVKHEFTLSMMPLKEKQELQEKISQNASLTMATCHQHFTSL